ncbi:MAG TPA: DinB family protein [Bacteroidota bacterium]|nr:DinB family protein [Bacteroidota bacterium]
MSLRRIVLLMLFALAGFGLPGKSQDNSDDEKLPPGFRGEFLAQLKDVQGKVVSLADAFPDDGYAWRPMEGVRSTREVLMHIAGANYLFPSIAGATKPEGLPKDMEKTVTERAKVREELIKSFDFIRDVVLRLPDADLDKPAKMFGQETTVRGVYLTAGLHMHEHLGQLIAYARMNHIVPPWTAAEEAAQKNKTKKE